MIKLPIKLFLYLLFAICYLLFASSLFAQEPGDIFSEQTVEKKVEQENLARDMEKDTPDEVQVFSTRTNNQLLGDTLYNTANLVVCLNQNTCTNNPNEEGKGKSLSAVGAVSSMIGKIYANPPASGLAYLQDSLTQAGFIKPAYAQGIGFAGLTSFLPFWKTSRNLAYSVLIIVMVAIGFMVIFRMKIDPKTVISVQAAIPKIVFAIIAITLSYPIVGFLIDIMYLAMAIVISLMVSSMNTSGSFGNIAELQSRFMTASAWDLLSTVFWHFGPFMKNFGVTLLKSFLVTGTTAGLIAAAFPPAIVADILGVIAIAGGLQLIIIAVLALALLFISIRLLLLLLNSYIQLLVNLILAPIILLNEAVPGRSAFSQWMMNIISNLVVFPATAVILLFSVYLVVMGQNGQQTWAPPFLGIWAPRGNFHALLGLGIIFMAPTLVAQIKKAFHPKPALPFTAGSVFAPATGGAQAIMGGMSQFYYFSSTADVLKRMFGGFGGKQGGTHQTG